tara:strand:+ start:140 stop:307 length:168 start_codon:yes stop_codon:yes gene_type:complete
MVPRVEAKMDPDLLNYIERSIGDKVNDLWPVFVKVKTATNTGHKTTYFMFSVDGA